MLKSERFWMHEFHGIPLQNAGKPVFKREPLHLRLNGSRAKRTITESTSLP